MRFSLAATARQSAEIRGNHYSNPYLGLAFSKPDGWRFRPESELHTLANSQTFAIDDPEIVDEIWMDIGLPLVSISSAAAPDETAPEADVWIEVNEGGNWDVVETQEETFTELYLPLLKDFSFEMFPTPFTFCGYAAPRC